MRTAMHVRTYATSTTSAILLDGVERMVLVEMDFVVVVVVVHYLLQIACD